MHPRFTADGFFPPGRYSVTMDEAQALLVDAERFRSSARRSELWSKFQEYIGNFVLLEDQYEEILEGRALIHRIWLGGSFVSVKPDPRNIDATLLIDEAAEKSIRRNPGSKWLTRAFQSRENMRQKFGVSPVRIGYRTVPHVFEAKMLTAEDAGYFRERGVWDDWWQRCRLRDGSDPAPSAESAMPVRGYLEVRL